LRVVAQCVVVVAAGVFGAVNVDVVGGVCVHTGQRVELGADAQVVGLLGAGHTEGVVVEVCLTLGGCGGGGDFERVLGLCGFGFHGRDDDGFSLASHTLLEFLEREGNVR